VAAWTDRECSVTAAVAVAGAVNR